MPTPPEHPFLYSRQQALWGAKRQDQLRGAAALVAGVGGVGCIVAEALARCGVGHLLLVDNGVVDWPDLSRQMLYTPEHIGRPKVEAARRRLRRLAPGVQVTALRAEVGQDDLRAFWRNCTVAADCLDVFAARFTLAESLPPETPLVHVALRGGYGQVITLERRRTETLRQLYQHVSQPADIVPVSAPCAYLLGTLAAQEMLYCIWGEPRLSNAMMLADMEHLVFVREALLPPE